MNISPLAGKPAPLSLLVDVPKLVSAYYTEIPDVKNPVEKVSFGTSGHRGSSLQRSFNETHILAITQALCFYRKEKGIEGPLFMGIDTHALSFPAYISALEVLAANGVEVVLAENDEFTPTPVISHAILTYNKGKKDHLSDGIVITPSHNPPSEGGFKYNPPTGGPADVEITNWIEKKANELIEGKLLAVKRISFEKALKANTTKRKDFIESYTADLENVIDMKAIKDSKVILGVDPLGGAGVHYWKRIADRYGINLTVISEVVDPTFRFMTVDWDGQIRMDPSSTYAMQRLIEVKDRFDVALACDTDHDRHGIVTKAGLLPSNNYIATMVYYLFRNRPNWKKEAAVGKTVVSSSMIAKAAEKVQRSVYEVPVGFKWFVGGLLDGSLGFVGEESAGATFLRRDGSVWTTDKDGITAALLAAEITAKEGKDPAKLYEDLVKEFGRPYYDRIDAKATREQKALLKKTSPDQISQKDLAGDPIQSIITKAPGNQAPIDGIKVISQGGWFAARPSGTEDIYKIYAETFQGQEHLQKIIKEAQGIVDDAIKGVAKV